MDWWEYQEMAARECWTKLDRVYWKEVSAHSYADQDKILNGT